MNQLSNAGVPIHGLVLVPARNERLMKECISSRFISSAEYAKPFLRAQLNHSYTCARSVATGAPPFRSTRNSAVKPSVGGAPKIVSFVLIAAVECWVELLTLMVIAALDFCHNQAIEHTGPS